MFLYLLNLSCNENLMYSVNKEKTMGFAMKFFCLHPSVRVIKCHLTNRTEGSLLEFTVYNIDHLYKCAP